VEGGDAAERVHPSDGVEVVPPMHGVEAVPPLDAVERVAPIFPFSGLLACFLHKLDFLRRQAVEPVETLVYPCPATAAAVARPLCHRHSCL